MIFAGVAKQERRETETPNRTALRTRNTHKQDTNARKQPKETAYSDLTPAPCQEEDAKDKDNLNTNEEPQPLLSL